MASLVLSLTSAPVSFRVFNLQPRSLDSLTVLMGVTSANLIAAFLLNSSVSHFCPVGASHTFDLVFLLV